jgi:hypothetical protein
MKERKLEDAVRPEFFRSAAKDRRMSPKYGGVVRLKMLSVLNGHFQAVVFLCGV